jgi:AI-2 transport protein TqsA
VVILGGSWWMLGQLANVLRPLLLAVFLGYMLMPVYSRMRGKVPAAVALGALAGVTAGGLVLLVVGVNASLVGLAEELPALQQRATELARQVREWVVALPYVGPPAGEWLHADARMAEQAATASLRVMNVAAGGLLEAVTAGLYLMFLLFESARFPERVRRAYPDDQADYILHVFGRINSAIISYLKAKVLSSLLIALPVGAILAVGGVRFALLWMVLTFLCNFIPYIGSVVAFALPVGFAFLQFGLTVPPVVVTALLLACHVASATTVEPMILGRAVGLSPLVILLALSVWGLVWGLPGMFLAVPLTVVLKIACENIPATQSVARLLSGD